MRHKKIAIIFIMSILFFVIIILLFPRRYENIWICNNGKWVMRGTPLAPEPTEPCGELKKENLIMVEKPQENEEITSPFILEGEARGNWFFEANAPVVLLDANDKEIAFSFITAKDDWMTADFIHFEGELEFETPETETGTLIFKKDNPSGLPENDDELRIPIVFAKQTKKVKLFYYNPSKDKDDSGNVKCSRDGLMEVERDIPITTKTPIQDTIKLLLLGELNEIERAQGIDTEYPLDGFSLKGALLKNGILTLEFDDYQNKTVGGSCRVGILWFQIDETAKQFQGVNEVRFLPEEIFQP